MSRRTITAALAMALALGTGAAAAPALAGTTAATTAVSSTGTAAAGWTDADSEALLKRLREVMPAKTPKVDELNRTLGIDPAAQSNALEEAIDGGDYQCGPTELRGWISESMADWSRTDRNLFDMLGVMNWTTYDALVYQPEGPQHYGQDGEYTQELTKTFGKLKRFWDVDGSDIQLGAMHSAVLMDEARMVRLLVEVYEFEEAEAAEIVAYVQEFLDQDKFDHGNHPIFSFNAFAYTEEGTPPSEQLGIGDKIIMGDGILEGMAAIGLDDVAPRGILAHEYGHQVQFELGRFDGHAGTPEATRETELEADALAGYYLSHPRGERLRNKRVQAFVRSFSEVGDCQFDSNGHHGTPNQRAASADWADRLANAKGKKGHILTARTVSDRFLAVLPEIIAPDA